MARFWGRINTGEARELIKRITKSASKNDVGIAQEKADEKKKEFVEKDKI